MNQPPADAPRDDPDFDQVITTLAVDLCRNAPNPAYGDFMANVVIPAARRSPAQARLPADPFSFDILDADEAAFVHRSPVWDHIAAANGLLCVVGCGGAGKSTLFRFPGYLTRPGELPAPIDLKTATLAFPAGATPTDSCAWMLRQLSARMFEIYWQQLLAGAQPLASYRRLRDWMERLRWFYRCFRPRPRHCADFELMAWLSERPRPGAFWPEMQPDQMLQELLAFITWPLPPQNPAAADALSYRGAHLLIDGIEELSDAELVAMTHALARAQAFLPGAVRGTLFLNDAGMGLITELRHASLTRVSVYRLPAWTETELRAMLVNRLVGRSQPPDYDWVRLFVFNAAEPRVISAPAARRLVKSLVDSAVTLAEQRAGYVDAPIHLLRLTRGALALCGYAYRMKGRRIIEASDIDLLRRTYEAEIRKAANV